MVSEHLPLGLIALGWALGWWLLGRPPMLRSIEPPDRRTDPPDDPGVARRRPDVAVVIPARDEADRIPLLLDDLAAQTVAPGELVVVDDESRDGTGAVAASRPGVAVVAPPLRPDGWTGKTWAVETGLAATTGSTVVTIDADVRLAPTALERVLAVHGRAGGLVSIQPRHDTVRAGEGLSLLFNIVAVMGLGVATPGRRHAGWAAAGPLLVTERADLVAVGGYATVRAEVAEDLALAAAYRDAGRAVTCLLGGDLVRFRMYRDVGELVAGWRKNMATGARRSPVALGVVVALWVAALAAAGVEVARAAVGGGSAAAAVVLYLAVAAQLLVLGRRVGRFGATALVWPVAVALFVGVFTASAVSTFVLRRVRWSGRTIRVGGAGPG